MFRFADVLHAWNLLFFLCVETRENNQPKQMLVLKKLTGLRSSLSSRQRFPLTFTTGKSEIPYEDAFIELSMWNSQKIIGKFEMGTS